jgi:flagellum-specific peptidoglycan hydrolase FlgJ
MNIFAFQILRMGKNLLILILLALSFQTMGQSAAARYIDTYDSMAMVIREEYGIPASVVLGIALVESGAGTSKLCRVNHNHFGVRIRERSSKTKSGYANVYKKYSSDIEAYQHFGELVSKKKYYATLEGNMDHLKWLKAMKAAKYATAPDWVPHINKTIHRYNLTRFDQQNPLDPPLPEAAPDTLGPVTK